MKFDLENLNPGTWFDFPDGEGRICLKTMSFEEADAIRKATVKVKAEYRSGVRYEYDVTDEDKMFDMTWEKCIVDWQDLRDSNDNVIPCVMEMKKKLMRGSPSFARMVREFLNQLSEAEKQEEEAEAKN